MAKLRKDVRITFTLDEASAQQLRTLADEEADGNVSLMVRKLLRMAEKRGWFDRAPDGSVELKVAE